MVTYGKIERRQIRGKPTKYYYVSTYDPETRTSSWRSTKCTSLREAKEWVRLQRERQLRGDVVVESTSLEVAVNEWLDEKADRVRPNYLENLRLITPFWLRHFGRDRTCRSVTSAMVEDYLRRRSRGEFGVSSRRRSAETVNTDRRALRNFFNFATRRGYSKDNPALTVPPFPGTVRKRTRYLSAHDQDRLLAACRDPYLASQNRGGVQERTPPGYLYPLVLTALRCGFRLRTLLSLEWGHVDLRDRMWRIPAEIMKSRSDYLQPAPRSVMEALESWRPACGDSVYVFGLGPGASIKKAFRSAVERSGVAPGTTFHDCRRVFLNSLTDSGVGLDVAMALTGQHDVATVLRHYRDVRLSETKAAIEALDRSQDDRDGS